MDYDRLLISERIDEVMRMCDREHPIYEQISNFSIALYVFGFFKCPDLLDADDVDEIEAGTILKEHFDLIPKERLPDDYSIFASDRKYLLVIGDPLFPVHFAVVADMRSQRPYFSKLKFYGSGFDSLAELEDEFMGKDGVGSNGVTYYQMKTAVSENAKVAASPKKALSDKIYVIKADGNYSVSEYQSAME